MSDKTTQNQVKQIIAEYIDKVLQNQYDCVGAKDSIGCPVSIRELAKARVKATIEAIHEDLALLDIPNEIADKILDPCLVQITVVPSYDDDVLYVDYEIPRELARLFCMYGWPELLKHFTVTVPVTLERGDTP